MDRRRLLLGLVALAASACGVRRDRDGADGGAVPSPEVSPPTTEAPTRQEPPGPELGR
jgi:hypothetical protein